MHKVNSTGTVFIGFGYKARQGKDTAAQAIIEAYKHRYYIRQYALADAIKAEVYDYLLRRGGLMAGAWPEGVQCPPALELDGPLLSGLTNAAKVAYVNHNKATLRQTLQTWGTEYRRAKDAYYWVDTLDQRLMADAPQVALITDIRFRNELGYIRGRGGVGVKVVRLGYTEEATTASHISEQELDGVQFDDELVAASVDELCTRAMVMFSSIMRVANHAD